MACITCDVRQATAERLQQRLTEARRRLREHADELELQRDRQLAVMRAELMQVRGILGEELR